jgi:nucleoside-diphosphate-sugar epimerase
MQVVRYLRSTGAAVRAVVRDSAEASRAVYLASLGAELVRADLKEPASIRCACRNSRTIVSTATAMRSRQLGDSIASVDLGGQLTLVEMAEREGVEHFVFVSFPRLALDFALQRSKRRVEEALAGSTLFFTVVQALNFCEQWLGAPAGFEPWRGQARILGDGRARLNWVRMVDIARFAAIAATEAPQSRRFVTIGGPESMSQLDVVELFEALGGPKVERTFVAETALEKQIANAQNNAVEEARAAVSLATAKGLLAGRPVLHRPVPWQLSTVRQYATDILNGLGGTTQKG